jgi:ABC-2 type transport system permease protein
MTAATLNPVQDRPAVAMPTRRLLRAYVMEARFEFVKAMRSAAASIPFLLLPIPLYFFFGVMLGGASPEMRTNPQLADYLFAGWAAFAVMMPAIFGVGCTLAVERTAGLHRLKRAQPAPPGAYIIAKLAMSLAFAALAMAELVIVALLAGKITMSGWALAGFSVTMIVGALPFCAIGLWIGAYFSGSAAPAVANLIFLPMLYLSGLFFPLPGIMSKLVVIWPAFHLNQAALAAAGVAKFVFLPPTITVGVLIAVTLFFGGLALQRLARVG